MARSNVTLKSYLEEIRHEANQAKKSKDFPNKLLYEWAHKDICETVLRLGGHINQLYRATASIAISSAAGHEEATATHVASSVTISGFTGLTPDAWIGGSVLAVVSGVIYSAQISDNDATTVTITVGTDLPAITDGTVLLTANDSKYSVSLSSLSMINYAEPIWEVLEADGTPIEQIPLEEARNVENDDMHADEAYWYGVGQTLMIAAGSSKALSGNLTVGYYILPVKASALTDYIDFPIEYHDLAQQRTMVRVLKKLDMIDRATVKERELDSRWAALERGNTQAPAIDAMTGERRQDAGR